MVVMSLTSFYIPDLVVDLAVDKEIILDLEPIVMRMRMMMMVR